MNRAQQLSSQFAIGESLYDDSDALIEALFENLYQTWLRWKSQFSEEEGIEDPGYMVNAFESTFAHQGFLFDRMKKKLVVKGSRRCSKAKERTSARCYYNALDNSIRNGYDLAYGYSVDPSAFDSIEATTKSNLQWGGAGGLIWHVFNMEKGKVIDPTLGKTKDLYYYKIIPKSIWSKMYHKFDDSNQDARELDKWIEKDASTHKFDFHKEFSNYVKRQTQLVERYREHNMNRAQQISAKLKGMKNEKFFDFLKVPLPDNTDADKLKKLLKRPPLDLDDTDVQHFIQWVGHAFVGELQNSLNNLHRNKDSRQVMDWKREVIQLYLQSKNH